MPPSLPNARTTQRAGAPPAVTGSPKRYAACLLKLSDLPDLHVRPLPALGALSASGLAVRIRRLVSRRVFASPALSRGMAAAVVVLLCVLVDARRRLPSLRRSSARTVLAVDLGMAFAMALMVTGVA